MDINTYENDEKELEAEFEEFEEDFEIEKADLSSLGVRIQ